MKLKITRGLHAGAEIAVDAASLLLGRDPQCDIVLSDEDLDPQHALLVQEGDFLRVRVFRPGVAQVDGVPVQREAAWLPGAVLDLQGVQIELQAPEPPAEDTAWPDTELAPAQLPDQPPLPPPAAARAAPPWRARIATGTACLACAVAVLAVTFRELPAKPTQAGAAPWSAAAVAGLLAREGHAGITTSTDAAGVPVLSGTVADEQALAALRTLFAAPLARGQLRLRVQTLTDQARTLAQQIDDPGVQVRFAHARQLVLSGTATRAATASKIVRLQQELADRFEIDARISYEKPVKTNEGPAVKEAPLRIAHISGGTQPSIVTQGGEQYFQGAKLADGTEVVSITTDKVVLRYGDKVVEYGFE